MSKMIILQPCKKCPDSLISGKRINVDKIISIILLKVL